MLNELMNWVLVGEKKEAKVVAKSLPRRGLTELTLNNKEAKVLLAILEEELSGKMYDRVFVMQSQFGRFSSWFWKRDIEWMFAWGDALKLRAYLVYKLSKGRDTEFTVHVDTLYKMPVYRKVG